MTGITPNQFRRACRHLWGGRWCITLAKAMNVPADHVFEMEYGERPISDEAIAVLKRSIVERIAGLQRTLHDIDGAR